MQRINVSTLGFDLTKEVPATTDEYNALAPKRNNPVLEDAIFNCLYRGTFVGFRAAFLDKLEAATSVTRINHGTEDAPQWESDGRLIKRMIAQSGLSEAAFRAQHQSLAQESMDAAGFNPAERESTGQGPSIGKGDLALAATVVKDGKADVVAAALGKKLGRVVDADEKSLARAIADDRKARAAVAAAAQKAELGL